MRSKRDQDNEEVLQRVMADTRARGYQSWPQFLSAYDAVLDNEKRLSDRLWKVAEDRRAGNEAIQQLSAFGNAEIDRTGAFTIHKKAFEKA